MGEVPTSAPPLAGDPEPLGRLRRAAISLWELTKTCAIVLALVAAIRTFVVEAYVVHGDSMKPTFDSGDRLLISKMAGWTGEFARGDVVVFEHRSGDAAKRLIKRIVGLPGETIEIRDGLVYLNGASKPLEEPYLRAPDGSFFPSLSIPEGKFFVLGDNRPVSNDSRRIGLVSADAILGKLLRRFYRGGSEADEDEAASADLPDH